VLWPYCSACVRSALRWRLPWPQYTRIGPGRVSSLRPGGAGRSVAARRGFRRRFMRGSDGPQRESWNIPPDNESGAPPQRRRPTDSARNAPAAVVGFRAFRVWRRRERVPLCALNRRGRLAFLKDDAATALIHSGPQWTCQPQLDKYSHVWEHWAWRSTVKRPWRDSPGSTRLRAGRFNDFWRLLNRRIGHISPP